jgi:5-dehydro-2-deoxygluconokinase
MGIYPVTALKPTGAGDAFMGGFVTGLAEGSSIRQSLQRGAASAALVVTRVGCSPANPTQDDLQSFMATHHINK